jgi:hypothetical protein
VRPCWVAKWLQSGGTRSFTLAGGVILRRPLRSRRSSRHQWLPCPKTCRRLFGQSSSPYDLDRAPWVSLGPVPLRGSSPCRLVRLVARVLGGLRLQGPSSSPPSSTPTGSPRGRPGSRPPPWPAPSTPGRSPFFRACAQHHVPVDSVTGCPSGHTPTRGFIKPEPCDLGGALGVGTVAGPALQNPKVD